MSILQKRKFDFEETYDNYADILFRLSLSYVKHREDAEDIVQDVFISYINASPDFSDEAHKRAWLIRVAINKCRDMARRKSIRQTVSYDEIGEIAIGDGSHNDSIELFSALQKLPEQNRVAIILHYFEGFSIAETAKMLSVSASAVKMRLSRGRQMLKELL